MAEQTTLPRHLVLAQNVRGIGVYDPADPPERAFFTWLARKHRYRNVGFPTSLLDHPSVDVAGYETFEPVGVPMDGAATAVEAVDGPRWAVEALLVGSAFVSPLLVHRPALPALEPYAAWRCHSARDLPEDQVLRHARIAGYGMLDCFEAETGRGFEAVVDGGLERAVDDRAEFAREDGEERFWRLFEEVSGDAWVGGYFDVLRGLDEPEALADALSANRDLRTLLGLVGGLAVDPPYD